jgi:hypothetical protein
MAMAMNDEESMMIQDKNSSEKKKGLTRVRSGSNFAALLVE